MKHTFKLSMLCSAILLAGCGDDTSSSGTSDKVQFEDEVQALLDRETSISFTLQGANADVPAPSYLLMDTSDGTLGLPTDGDDALTNPRASMNTMDGWSTSMPIVLNFNGDGFATGMLSSGVKVIKINQRLTEWDGKSNPIEEVLVQNQDYVVQAKGSSLYIQFLAALDESSEYIFAVTQDVTDVNGEPIGTSASYATVKSKEIVYETGDLASVQAVTQAVEGIFGLAQVDPNDIVYSSWFSTQSVGDTLAAVKGVTATGFSTGANTLNTVYKNDSNEGSVDLSTAYTITLGETQDFSTALDSDDDFSKYISDLDAAKTAIKGLYMQSGADVSVTQGVVRLPHYLEKGASWNMQPMVSAMPSLAKLSAALADPNEQANMVQQLSTGVFANDPVDVTKLATDPTEQLKLVGAKLTLTDGTQLDSERIITRYSPVPVVKSVEDVEVLVFTPKSGVATDVVIYQHGITSAKENAYAFAFNMVKAGVAVIAIDLPIHGTRSLDEQRSANANVLAYLNLSNLAVARDNLRQSVLDVLGLRASLVVSAQGGLLAGGPLQGFNPMTGSKVKMLGHSLGGIVATSAVAAANNTLGSSTADALYTFSSASVQNSGGQIGNLLLGSDNYGPQIKHNLAYAASKDYANYADASCADLEDKTCYEAFEAAATEAQVAALEAGFSQFIYAAQTTLDTVDPFTNASDLVASGSLTTPFFMTEVDGDSTVPNSVPNAPFAGTEPLANKLGLKTVNSTDTTVNATASFVQFNATASHSTFASPNGTLSDIDHHVEMQMENTDFLMDDALTGVTNTSVLK
ncbi:Extracellular lipase precursor [Vibrio alginolyticus]|uniref:Extracellular lipase n=1 Tax=Vibrio alginolyticus TaxID=663 RepID=A0A1W6UCU2_VIBAL|nr:MULTISPECIES: VolA/Pla-1 family phospholipase [Vibrio]ARP00954.1 Extracellular lipase precursor [Vibrio alginolyticus]ARP05654.1 Extracellular lipase precursor [Vibrio alginolyticus]ARP10765.1 Extracellular lipase precursor [Vibrio alginolyticus]ARP15823.1 Extracellular lipase precursor [Vibrio alginolyticus]ARP20865.1 Extracellular lipase precursor [Vibrio alginolyticus]